MDVRRVGMLLILDNYAEDLGTWGIITEVFFCILPDFKSDGHKYSLSTQSEVIAVEVAYQEKISFSFTNPRSCKCLDPLGDFPIFGCSPVIYEVYFLFISGL